MSDLTLERHKNLLTQGAVLVDETDPGTELRALFYLEHTVQDGRKDRNGNPLTLSKQLHFVELAADGTARSAGYAPYLDYRPLEPHEQAEVEGALEAHTFEKETLEREALNHTVLHLMPAHFAEVKARKENLIVKTRAAVKDRLTKEITYWDHRAAELKLQEEAGKQPRMNPQLAQRRADDLQVRLETRMKDLDDEARMTQRPPVIVGSVLVVPGGLLSSQAETWQRARDTVRVERLAMDAVMAAERELGFEPRDVGAQKIGYDVESRNPADGSLRFIEVKGRVKGAATVTVTKNEILTALNKPEQFILALVEVDENATTVRYVRTPFVREPDFGVTSVNYNLKELWVRAEATP